jgi:hypothetical protein
MTMGEILSAVGQPEGDIGSGLHVLVWRCSDGRRFLVGTTSLDSHAKPVYARFE